MPEELPDIPMRRLAYVAGPPKKVNPNAFRWERSGLYNADRRPDPLVDAMMLPRPRLPVGRADMAPEIGDAIFSARYRPHFGHLITESIGRLWATEHLPSETPLLWFAHPRDAESEGHLLHGLLALLSVSNPVEVVAGAVRVQQLHVPPTLNDPLFLIPADDRFQEWFARRLPASAQPAGGEKLYVSRLRMGDKAGRFLGEAAVEEGLRAQGYDILHPERVPLAKQVAAYRAARHVILAEGSPLHLLALLDVPGQEIAIIQRRPRVVASIPPTLASFRRARVRLIDRITDCWNTGPSAAILFRVVSRLDMPAVWTDLAAAGFIRSARGMPVPTSAEVTTERETRAPDRSARLKLRHRG